MLHFAVSISDALDEFRRGHILKALGTLANRRNLMSLGAITDNARMLSRLANGRRAAARTRSANVDSERTVTVPGRGVGHEQEKWQSKRDDQGHAQRVVANRRAYAPPDGEANTHRADNLDKSADRARVGHRDGG
jgi:hypothetical protein